MLWCILFVVVDFFFIVTNTNYTVLFCLNFFCVPLSFIFYFYFCSLFFPCSFFFFFFVPRSIDDSENNNNYKNMIRYDIRRCYRTEEEEEEEEGQPNIIINVWDELFRSSIVPHR